MPYKRGDRIYWNSGTASDPNYWTGTVMEDKTSSNRVISNMVICRYDGYGYQGPYNVNGGNYHTHDSGSLFPMPPGMKLSTIQSLWAKDPALRNSQLPTAGQSQAAMSTSSPLINDYTCTRCKNNRVSKTERSCWKCGEPVVMTHS